MSERNVSLPPIHQTITDIDAVDRFIVTPAIDFTLALDWAHFGPLSLEMIGFARGYGLLTLRQSDRRFELTVLMDTIEADQEVLAQLPKVRKKQEKTNIWMAMLTPTIRPVEAVTVRDWIITKTVDGLAVMSKFDGIDVNRYFISHHPLYREVGLRLHRRFPDIR
ncbi:hypothetical protein M1116_04210 [Patescibacteria group bacterium]|nr:hypothetical protein [Patescibacteria group bacterium]